MAFHNIEQLEATINRLLETHERIKTEKQAIEKKLQQKESEWHHLKGQVRQYERERIEIREKLDKIMCGPLDSVIGMERENVIQGFLSQLPRQFEVARENVALQGIVVELDDKTGRAREIRRLRVGWEAND